VLIMHRYGVGGAIFFALSGSFENESLIHATVMGDLSGVGLAEMSDGCIGDSMAISDELSRLSKSYGRAPT